MCCRFLGDPAQKGWSRRDKFEDGGMGFLMGCDAVQEVQVFGKKKKGLRMGDLEIGTGGCLKLGAICFCLPLASLSATSSRRKASVQSPSWAPHPRSGRRNCLHPRPACHAQGRDRAGRSGSRWTARAMANATGAADWTGSAPNLLLSPLLPTTRGSMMEFAEGAAAGRDRLPERT